MKLIKLEAVSTLYNYTGYTTRDKLGLVHGYSTLRKHFEFYHPSHVPCKPKNQ